MSEVEALENKAKNGDAEAMYQLGTMYAFGLGVPRDLDKALHWLKKAAEQGYSEAGLVLQDVGRSSGQTPNASSEQTSSPQKSDLSTGDSPSTYQENKLERVCLWFAKRKYCGREAVSFALVLFYIFVVMCVFVVIYVGNYESINSNYVWGSLFLSLPGFVSLVPLPHLMAYASLNNKRQVGLKIILWNLLFIHSSVIIRLFLYHFFAMRDDIALGVCWALFLYELLCMGRMVREAIKMK